MRYVLLALFYLLAQPTFAWAEASDADKAQFRHIISDQMAAFRAGDAAAAFGFASPALQAKFGSAAMFMEMVRDGYQPVYRPKAVDFGTVVDRPQGPEQQVFVTAPDGGRYLAHYMMERQPDGSWRISGCYLERVQDESV